MWNITHKLVRKKAELRQLADAARQARSIALNPGADPDEALAEAERLLMASRDRVTKGRIVDMAQVMPKIAKEFEERRKGGKDPNALPTGFRTLDKQLGGGMRPGDLIIGAGRTSMGKTSFGLSMALNVAVRQGENRPDRLPRTAGRTIGRHDALRMVQGANRGLAKRNNHHRGPDKPRLRPKEAGKGPGVFFITTPATWAKSAPMPGC